MTAPTWPAGGWQAGGWQAGGWQNGLSADDDAAARALFARVRAADGRGPMPDENIDPSTDIRLVRAGDQLVGIAWRSGDDPAELLVDPAYRRRGVGTELARGLADRGGTWAHGNSPAAAALAARLGLVPTRTLLQLRRDLAGPWPVELPAGVAIRTFRIGGDEEEFLRVNAAAFAWHPEQGRLVLPGLLVDEAQPWFDPAGFFLAVADDDEAGRVLGFHWTKIHPTDPTPPAAAAAGPPPAGSPLPSAGPIGEVYVLGVDPQSPIRRLGAPLTAVGLAYLAARGLSTVMLYVESDNVAALKLYRRFGFADYQADVVFARPVAPRPR